MTLFELAILLHSSPLGIFICAVGHTGERAGTFAHLFARFANGKHHPKTHESQQLSYGRCQTPSPRVLLQPHHFFWIVFLKLET